MQATADPLDLNPPSGGRWRGPLGGALAVHGLLVLALTWGVGWQTDTVVVAEAELWSRLPQVAAPRLVAPEPTPTPAPVPKPRPAEPPPPDVLQAQRDADIALAQQQKKAREEQARQQALARAAEQQRRERLAREQAAREQAEKAKAEQQAKAAREKAEKAAAARQDALLEAERQKNLARMMGQAGATGSANARGTAQQSSGPSAGYAGKLVARIRPNIVFADAVAGNPRAEVEVKVLPDGTIVGSRLLQSSGHMAWDNAVLRAVERTGKLPQDENGRVPGTLILGFRPQD